MSRRFACVIGWIALVGLWPGSAWAADSSTIKSASAYGTIHFMGVYVAYEGDDNNDASATLRYRMMPSGAWVQGHRLLRLSGRRWVGSLFDLKPAQRYELEVTITDPDGAPAPRRFQGQTLPDAPPAPPADGKHIYVDAANGKVGAAGTKSAPLATIQAAADRTQPGDTVHVLPGVYRESLVIKKAGTATRPITYLAEGKGVILDGADPAIQSGATWTAVGDGIYSTPFTQGSLYVAADDTRLYDYGSLADLRAENGRQSGMSGILKGGFFVDSGAKKLYLRLPGRTDPANHKIHVAVLDVAVRLETTSYIVFRGFELRYYGGQQYGSIGIDVRNSHHCWIQKNHIHHTNSGISVRKTAVASNNVIEDNVIRDTSVWQWPWRSVKAHTPEASAITISHGRGNIVRRNRTEGQFNGIYTGSFGDQTNEDIAKDTDVYDNQLAMHGDDGLEPEGANINVRFVRNRIDGVFNGISLAPITVGPLWAIRTALLHYRSHGLKLNNGSVGWMLIYHTTAIPDASVADAQAFAPSVPFGGLIARNNIWAANRYVFEYTRTSLQGPVSLEYDLLWTSRSSGPWFKWLNTRYADLPALQKGAGLEMNSVAGQPQFVDAAGGDFRPATGSPMVDKGVFLDGINRTSAAGAKPDIGAYESGKPLPPQEPPSQEPPPQENPAEPLPQDDPGQEPDPPSEPPTQTDASPDAPTPADRASSDAVPGERAQGDLGPQSDNSPSSDSVTTQGSAPGPGGCGCDAVGFFGGGWLWLLGLVLVVRRRPWFQEKNREST